MRRIVGRLCQTPWRFAETPYNFIVWICVFAVIAPLLRAHAEEQSLGDKIKEIFEPTPPPKKKHKHSAAKPSPSPSPSASPKKKSSPKPQDDADESTPKPKKKASPTPSRKASPKAEENEDEATPKPKKKSSPSPSPKAKASPSPSATPEESPTPTPSPSASPSPNEQKKERPPGVSVSPNDISGFEQYPDRLQKLIRDALDLASRDLSYKYGSADPANGGMDCSGFIYYVLRENGISDVPRDSSEQYVWVRKSGHFEAVVSKKDDTFELANLKPGDLLFWTGTYEIERDPPVTHAMIYVGKEKSTGRRIMVGASDGRTYHDQSRYGVSVFDFRVSTSHHNNENGRTPDFVGYGKIPGLGDG